MNLHLEDRTGKHYDTTPKALTQLIQDSDEQLWKNLHNFVLLNYKSKAYQFKMPNA
jgi:hypothetical protein